MRIVVFGAAGNVGRRVVAEALGRGHAVTAVVRDVARAADVPSGAVLRAGDASDAQQVAALSAGQELAISATRPAPGSEGDLVLTARALFAGLSRTGVRLLLVGGAASLVVPDTGGLVVDDPRYVPPAWRDIALACCEQLAVCRTQGDVDWAYLSPPALLEPGERTGRYRLGRDELLIGADGRSRISMEDFAVALIDEAERCSHRQARFTVGY
ncbi:NAD(P)-dependent oxidoreductase [Chelativorans intermedius]|uniref:NAD(P)-dependent oxidoreductase n=1 Tax=Chelativorans intermedius TaxID=515947 RepID=A0ABV6D4D7_9HYPH|nr:NAD(P)H-binding protein [Chelativorans intermedius]MCT8997623.1 NAD(P)H-binding protein [Chelativorans intermedius]